MFSSNPLHNSVFGGIIYSRNLGELWFYVSQLNRRPWLIFRDSNTASDRTTRQHGRCSHIWVTDGISTQLRRVPSGVQIQRTDPVASRPPIAVPSVILGHWLHIRVHTHALTRMGGSSWSPQRTSACCPVGHVQPPPVLTIHIRMTGEIIPVTSEFQWSTPCRQATT